MHLLPDTDDPSPSQSGSSAARYASQAAARSRGGSSRERRGAHLRGRAPLPPLREAQEALRFAQEVQ